MNRTARLACSLLMVMGLGACGKKSEPKAAPAPAPQVAPIAPPAGPSLAPAPRVAPAAPVAAQLGNAAPVAAPVTAVPGGNFKGKVTGNVGATAIDIGLTECSTNAGKGKAKGAGFSIEYKMWAGTLMIETEGRTWQAMANLQGDGQKMVSTQGIFDSQTGWSLLIVCT